jgi:small subunit ribosomal protein S5
MPQESTQKTTQKTNTSAGDNKGKTDAQNTRSQKGGDQKKGGQSGHKQKRQQDRGQRSAPEFDYSVVDIRRVTRVVAGGRRFSFRVTVVAGNHQGRVGVGVGKAADTPVAIDKAFRDAKANMIEVDRTAHNSIPCEIEASYCGSHVLILPSLGRGVIAGSTVRPVIEMAGLNDVTTKLLSRSKNKLNNARVAVEALRKLPKPEGEDVQATAQKTANKEETAS